MKKGLGRKLVDVLSVCYLTGAIFLAGVVCFQCFPEFKDRLRHIMIGLENGPVQEAFSTFADSLEAGIPLKDSLKATVEWLVSNVC